MKRAVLRLATVLRVTLVLGSLGAPWGALAYGSDAVEAPPRAVPTRKELREMMNPLKPRQSPELCAVGWDEPSPEMEVIKRLSSFGPPILPLLKPYLTNPDYHLRGSVFHVYARVGDATALRALQSAARSRNPDIRGQAFSALTLMQPLPASVNESLTQALNDPDDGVRSTVLARLATLLRALPGADRQVWLPRLEPLLQSKSLRDRLGAMQVLGTLVPEVPEAMPALITRLQDPDEDIRAEAADALARFKEQAQAAVEPLSALTGDPKPRVQFKAIKALLAIEEPAARRFLPLLRTHLTAPASRFQGYTRGEVSQLLAQLGQWEDAASIAQVLASDSSTEVRQPLIRLSQWKGPTTQAGGLEGEQRLTSRGQLIESLGQLGHPHPEALFTLAELLSTSRKTQELQLVARALGKLGQPAVPVLLRFLQPEHDPLEGVPYVIQALGEQIGRVPEQIVPVLLARLERNASDDLEHWALEMLRRGGPVALEHLEAWAARGDAQRQHVTKLLYRLYLPDMGPLPRY